MTEPIRRFTHPIETGNPWALKPGHQAIVNAKTRYPKTVRKANPGDRVLKSGVNNRKVGGKILKGHWRGMPVFTLTLEERATCPRSCFHWQDCYGNKMHLAHRFDSGPELEQELRRSVKELAYQNPAGFVVRLHVLGDFYSVMYVRLWEELLDKHPELRIFGYTAWQPNTPIGMEIQRVRRSHRRRFSVRVSDGIGEMTTVSLEDEYEAPEGSIVCPAQTGKTDCCSTCGLCWTTPNPIAFIQH